MIYWTHKGSGRPYIAVFFFWEDHKILCSANFSTHLHNSKHNLKLVKLMPRWTPFHWNQPLNCSIMSNTHHMLQLMEVKVWGPGGDELVFIIARIEYSPEWHHQVSQSYQGRVNISKEANLGGRMVSWSTDNTHIRDYFRLWLGPKIWNFNCTVHIIDRRTKSLKWKEILWAPMFPTHHNVSIENCHGRLLLILVVAKTVLSCIIRFIARIQDFYIYAQCGHSL